MFKVFTNLDKFRLIWTSLDQFQLIWTNLDHFKPIYTSLNPTPPQYPQPQCHQRRRERSAISICHLGTVSGTKVHIDAFHLFSIWFKQHHATYNHKCLHFLSKLSIKACTSDSFPQTLLYQNIIGVYEDRGIPGWFMVQSYHVKYLQYRV